MKQTKAYNLETEAIEAIEKYRNDKGIKSSSNALERIILTELPKQIEYEDLKAELQELKNLIKNIKFVNPVCEVSLEEETKEEIENKNSNILNSFKASYNNMPE